MSHPTLNLPVFSPKLKIEKNQEFIFDSIRKKYLVLTPEEWVRQHFVHLLTRHLNYPSGLFQLERQHNYFKSKKRADIVILNSLAKPHLLVECKSYKIELDLSTLQQISAYNKTLQAQFVAITNGLKHFVWEFKNGDYVQLKDFPVYTT